MFLWFASHFGHTSVIGAGQFPSSHLTAAASAYRQLELLRTAVIRPPCLQVPQHLCIVLILSGGGPGSAPRAYLSGHIDAAAGRAPGRLNGPLLRHRLSPRRPGIGSQHPLTRWPAALTPLLLSSILSGRLCALYGYMAIFARPDTDDRAVFGTQVEISAPF